MAYQKVKITTGQYAGRTFKVVKKNSFNYPTKVLAYSKTTKSWESTPNIGIKSSIAKKLRR